MAKIKRQPMPWTTVYCDTNLNQIFLPATPWMAAADIDKVRCTFEVQGRVGADSLVVKAGYQVANTENSPSPTQGTSFGQSSTTAGISYADGWTTTVADDTADAQLIRFGWVLQRSSGTGLIFARVAGLIEIMDCQ